MIEDKRKTVPIGLASSIGEYTAHRNLVLSASVITTIPTLDMVMIIPKTLVSELAANAVKQ